MENAQIMKKVSKCCNKITKSLQQYLQILGDIQKPHTLQILNARYVFGRHTPNPSFCSGSRIETMVRVSVCPSLTEGLCHGQVTLRQMLAVDGCKMLPLKPSHCIIPNGKRNGTLVSYYQFYTLTRKLFLIFRNTVTVDHSANPFLLLSFHINF